MLNKETFKLGEGMIKDDIDLLDKPTYFPSQICLTNVEELFSSIESAQDLNTVPENKAKVVIFAERFVEIDAYGIHIMLKWMIYCHRLMDKFKIKKLFEVYEQIMSKIDVDEPNVCNSKFQHYMKKIMLKPYFQFLQKLAVIKKAQLKQANNSIKNIFNNLSDSTNDGELAIEDPQQNMECMRNWYQMYNLILFILQEFPKPIKELKGYFQECYPYLNNVFSFIKKDTKIIHSKVQAQYSQMKQSHVISLIQMETLSDRVNQFLQINEVQSSPINTFITDDSNQQNWRKDFKIDEFLESPLKKCKENNHKRVLHETTNSINQNNK